MRASRRSHVPFNVVKLSELYQFLGANHAAELFTERLRVHRHGCVIGSHTPS